MLKQQTQPETRTISEPGLWSRARRTEALTSGNYPTGDLFYPSLIKEYVQERGFVERPWLARRVLEHLADPGCRFLLVTGEPGAGKTALAAWLAQRHPDWPRYFVRRDSKEPLSGGDARSFLFSMGHQLAALRPGLFRSNVKIEVKQRVGQIQSGGSAAAIQVDELRISPFRQTTLLIDQRAEINAGELVGLSARRATLDERLLELSNLQHMALFEPAAALRTEAPEALIVVVIDALDELRYQSQDGTILKWLENCPELPDNVRVILTARTDTLLDVFRGKQGAWLRELSIDPDSEEVQADLRRYASAFVAEADVRDALHRAGVDEDQFLIRSVTRAEGNFLYLAMLYRGVRQAIQRGGGDQVRGLLNLTQLPNDLDGLYAFFLDRIEADVAGMRVKTWPNGRALGQKHVPEEAWTALYQPILGVLAVAREPLDAGQLQSLAAPEVEKRYVRDALSRLRQFLDQEGERYRLYHGSFAEFLLGTQAIDAADWHRRIVEAYRGEVKSWDEVNWQAVDAYGLSHLAEHLHALREDDELRSELYGLINQPYMDEKRSRTGSQRAFAQDLQLAISVAEAEAPPQLVQVLRNSLLYATVRAQATEIPPEVLGTLGRVGESETALGYAALQLEPAGRSEGYRQIAGGLLAAGQVQEARENLARALVEALSIESLSAHGKALRGVAETMAQADDEEGLSRALGAAFSLLPGGRPYPSALPGTATLKSLPPPLAHLLLPAGQDDEEAMRGVAVALARAGDADRAIKVADRLSDTVLRADIGSITSRSLGLGQVAQALAQTGQVEQALDAADLAFEAYARVDALYLVALALTEAGEMEQAKAAARLALDNAELVSESDLAYREYVSDGLEALANAQKSWALCESAYALARAGEAEQAQRVVSRVLEREQTLSMGDAQDSGERVRLIAETLVWAGDVDRALEVARAIVFPPTRAWALSKVAQAIGRSGRTKEAGSVAQEILAMPMSAPYDALALPGVAESLARSGSVGRALEAVRDLRDDGTEAYREGRAEALHGIAAALADRHERPAQNEVLEGSRNIANQATRALALTLVAQVLADMDEVAGLHRALDIAQEFTDKRQQALALSGVTQALAQVGALDRARSAAAAALQAGQAVPGERSRVEALDAIAGSLVQVGQAEQARWVANRAVQVAETIPGDGERTKALIGAARTLFHTGELESARVAFDRALSIGAGLSDETEQAEVLTTLAEVAAELGREDDLPGILELVGQISADGHRIKALSAVAQGWALVGKKERARRVAVEALSAAQAVSDEGARAQALSSVSEALVKLGAVDELEEAMQAAQAIPGEPYEPSKDIALLTISEGLAQHQQLDQALTAAESIAGPPRAWALRSIVDALAEAEETGLIDLLELHVLLDRAEMLAQTSDQVTRPKALAVVTKAHVRAGDLLSAGAVAALALEAALAIPLDWVPLMSVKDGSLVSVLIDLAQFFATVGDKDRAKTALKHAVQISLAREGTDGSSQTAALKAIASDLRESGELAPTIKTVLAELGEGVITSDLLAPIGAPTEQEQRRRQIQELLAAVERARRGRRDDVWKAVQENAGLLAGIDGGDTLGRVVSALEETDTWWS